MTTRCAVATCMLSAVLAGSAIAQPQPSPEQLYEQGVRFYNLAQYDEAADAFQHAYLLSGQPGLLFNIAQAFRHGHHCSDALQFYRNYLRAQPDAPARASVERHISEMEVCANDAAGHPVATAATAQVAPPPDSPERSHSTLWIWALGAGVGLAAAGTALMVSTSSGLDSCSPSCSPPRLDALRLRADLGYGAFGAAGVAIGAAAWLWFRGADSDRVRPARGVSISRSGIAMWSAF